MQQSIQLPNKPNSRFSFNVTNIHDEQVAVDMHIRTLVTGRTSIDIDIDGEPVVRSRLANNLVPMVAGSILKGNLFFVDIEGEENPTYDKFNTRFFLIYDDEFKLETRK